MQATMMDYPLTLTTILERAGKLFGKVEIVSRLPDKSLHRYTYADFYRRARALAEALTRAGLERGDRVATLMWNHYAHLEAYFGAPVAGGVVHTLNLRLHPAELAYIINHAADRFLIVDDVLLPLYEKFKDHVKLDRVLVVPLTGKSVPQGCESYEDFLAQAKGDFAYPQIGEYDAAAMCYTSGTTGAPKGVVYSHRAIVLHSFATALPDIADLAQRDVILPVVPMFHVNAWALPFGAPMIGCKQVYPGPHYDPESLLDLFEREQVTYSCGVPTVWLGLLEALEKNPGRWKLAPNLHLTVGGAAAPEPMFHRFDKLGIRLCAGWGMTEMTPVGSVSFVKSYLESLPEAERTALRSRAGIPLPFVEIRARNDAGEVPWDGKTVGELEVRGPWVAASYYKLPEETTVKWTPDGWFRTGDVVTIDAEGYIKIVDRSKDLIKSGGEWISSVDLENTLMAHPAVREAAVIAVPDPRWQERPLAVVVLKDGAQATSDELREFLAKRFARWQLPEAFVFTNALPRTGTGKIQKTLLREQYAHYPREQPSEV
jgi:fatty-acyl-CoA synthase